MAITADYPEGPYGPPVLSGTPSERPKYVLTEDMIMAMRGWDYPGWNVKHPAIRPDDV